MKKSGEENSILEETSENNEGRNDVAVTMPEEETLGDFLPLSKDLFRPGHFSAVLSKIDEVDESKLKSPPTSSEFDVKEAVHNEKKEGKTTQSPHVMWKSEDEIFHIDENKRVRTKQRPKSANSIAKGKPSGKHSMKRSSSACAAVHFQGSRTASKSALKSSSSSSRNSDSESNSESSFISVLGRPRSAGSKPRSYTKRHSPWHDICLWGCYPTRPSSACGIATNCYSDDYCLNTKATWIPCDEGCMKYQPRKCISNPNLTRSKRGQIPDLQIDKFKRSLKLLGLEVTDFGIYDSGSDTAKYRRTRGKVKQVESTFSTKVVKRSISLDGLKEEVREAWLDDRLDSSHRKLLAQAAYEEWYFRKAEEAHKKLVNEKIQNKLLKEKLEDEFKCRRVKAEEQFQKWIEGKAKRRIEKNLKKPALAQFRVVKTREEVEIAYHRWKKEKDKQRKERQKLELIEKEKQMDVERQKEEKRAMAERAFNEWKRKLEETEKNMAEAKLKKERRKKELEVKREQQKKTSFQTWKDMKDTELLIRRQEHRNAQRIANALRSAQLEERMYEAEQAFEEWLEKIELRESVLNSKKTLS